MRLGSITMLALVLGLTGAHTDTLLSDDFSVDTMDRWTTIDQGLIAGPSEWAVRDGALWQTSNVYHRAITTDKGTPTREWLGTLAIAGDANWTDYRFEFDFNSTDDDGVGCVFRFIDTGNYYQFQVDGTLKFYQLTRKLNGAFYCLASGAAGFVPEKTHHVTVRLKGEQIQVALDGRLLADLKDGLLAAGKIGLETRGCENVSFDNVKVESDPGMSLAALELGDAEVLFADEFDQDSMSRWHAVDIGTNMAPSNWSISDGAVHNTSNIYTRAQNPQHPEWDWTGTFLVARDFTLTDGLIDTVFWSTDDDGIGLTWRFADQDNYYKYQVDASAKFWQISKTVGGKFTCLAHGKGPVYVKGQRHRLQVRVRGAISVVYLDGQMVGAIEDTDLSGGSVGFESRGNSGSHFEYMRVLKDDAPLDTDAIGADLMKQAVDEFYLPHLAFLPGETMQIRVPHTTPGRLARLRLQVIGADGKTLARMTPRAGGIADLWRNEGAGPGVGRVQIIEGENVVREIPFNSWREVPRDIGVCAHRGDNRIAPENTIPAIESAVAKGAHQIEFDVYTSSDGKLVVIHDNTLDRTTNGSGPVTDYTFEQLRALDAGSWKGDQWKGTQIPTFREVVQAVPEYIQLNCHLKSGAGLAAQVAKQVLEMGRKDQCFLACSVEQAKEAWGLDREIRVCNMSGQQGPDTDYAGRTIAMGAKYIQILGWHDVMPVTCHRLREAGVTINYFGTSDPEFFRRLLEAGVQYPLVDNLDAMIPVLESMGVEMARG